MTSKEAKPTELDELLHPAHAFSHPDEFVSDPDLTVNEKRAILASWASDACAVEASPALRETPHGKTISVDDVLEALRTLDRLYHSPIKIYIRTLRRRKILRPDAGHDINGFL